MCSSDLREITRGIKRNITPIIIRGLMDELLLLFLLLIFLKKEIENKPVKKEIRTALTKANSNPNTFVRGKKSKAILAIKIKKILKVVIKLPKSIFFSLVYIKILCLQFFGYLHQAFLIFRQLIDIPCLNDKPLKLL